MFDTVKIGRKIAELRKAHNMTQFELADALGISFQAVSNWERGASMPDISKLPELADIFGVTIDEVLGKKNPAIVQLAHGETIDTRAATPEEIEEAAMIAKPSQLEKTVADNFDNLTDAAAGASSPESEDKTTGENGEKSESHDYGVLKVLLPYLNDSDVARLAREALAKGRGIGIFLPFMDEESVDELAQSAFENGGIGAITSYLPFMSDDKVDGMLAIASRRGDSIASLLPFASDSAIDACADEYAAQGRDTAILLPFLSDDKVLRLARLACKRDGTGALKKYLPFLRDDGIRQLMKEFVKE